MPVTRTQVQAHLARHLRSAPPLRKALTAEQESRYVLGVAYPAGRLDGHGEFMAAPEVEKAAWGFMRDGGRQIGFYHADGTVGHADVVESWIHRGPDWALTDLAGNTQTVKAGDWLLGAVFDEQTWPLVKTRRVDGWSIDGVAKRRTVPRTVLEEGTP